MFDGGGDGNGGVDDGCVWWWWLNFSHRWYQTDETKNLQLSQLLNFELLTGFEDMQEWKS